MEIKNYTSAVNAYRYTSEITGKSAVSKEKNIRERTNTDKAEFSSASRTGFADCLKAAAKNAADQSASAERINALAQSIKDGTYNISAEDVADSILGL